MGKAEGAIQKDIMDYLNILGIENWRTNSGKVRVKGGYMQLAKNGTSDIIGYMPNTGKILAIEVKTPGELPTKVQEVFLNKVCKNGGYGICTSDLNVFIETFKNILRKNKNNIKLETYERSYL